MNPGPDLAGRPIFVVGVPRSGTTLLRYMLCSHPRIYVPPESNFIPRFFRRRPTGPLDRGRALRILQRLRDYRPFWRDWRDDPLDPEELLGTLPQLTPAALIDALYTRYRRQYGAVRWGDKSPIYTAHIDVLARMFPASQIVHVIRDARDVTASSLQAYRGRRFFYIDPYYVARTWRERVDQAIAAGRRLPAHRYHEIRYEDLTADPVGRLSALCAFLGEGFHPDMARPEAEARRHHHSTGIHRRVRRPVTTASAGRWRTDLSPENQRLVQRVAGDLLPRLGYPLVDLGRPSGRERFRTVALAVKYQVLRAGRGLLRAAGLFHPTRLLERRRRPRTSGRGRAVPPNAADTSGPTSAPPSWAGDSTSPAARDR